MDGRRGWIRTIFGFVCAVLRRGRRLGHYDKAIRYILANGMPDIAHPSC